MSIAHSVSHIIPQNALDCPPTHIPFLAHLARVQQLYIDASRRRCTGRKRQGECARKGCWCRGDRLGQAGHPAGQRCTLHVDRRAFTLICGFADQLQAAAPRPKGAPSRAKKASIASDEIPMDALSSEPDSAPAALETDPAARRVTRTGSGSSPRHSLDGRARRDQSQQRSARDGRDSRGSRDEQRGADRSARGSRSDDGQPPRRIRAGADQRAAARSTPRPPASGSGSAIREVDAQSDSRPRGKQAVEAFKFDSSFSALFGKGSLISAARAAKGAAAEESLWALERGMKPDQGGP